MPVPTTSQPKASDGKTIDKDEVERVRRILRDFVPTKNGFAKLRVTIDGSLDSRIERITQLLSTKNGNKVSKSEYLAAAAEFYTELVEENLGLTKEEDHDLTSCHA